LSGNQSEIRRNPRKFSDECSKKHRKSIFAIKLVFELLADEA